MSEKRWIKLYKGIMESAVWSDALRLKAWIHILLSANYKDKEWFHNGQTVRIKRGQFVTSIRKLADAWGCSKDTTRRILKQFDELDMVRHNSDTGRYTLITVVKYEVFQDSRNIYCDSDKDSDVDTDKDTDKDSDKDSDTTQHKNNKKYKNKKNKKEYPAAPSSAPDDYGGPVPDDWSPAKERDWREANKINAEFQTREEFREEGIKYNLWDRYDEEDGT